MVNRSIVHPITSNHSAWYSPSLTISLTIPLHQKRAIERNPTKSHATQTHIDRQVGSNHAAAAGGGLHACGGSGAVMLETVRPSDTHHDVMDTLLLGPDDAAAWLSFSTPCHKPSHNDRSTPSPSCPPTHPMPLLRRSSRWPPPAWRAPRGTAQLPSSTPTAKTIGL